jgi:hypothetical protein
MLTAILRLTPGIHRPALWLLCSTAAFCLLQCASTRDREVRSYSRVYPQPYDSVWNAVTDLVYLDLKCASKKTDKDRGVIETEWVHLIDTDGTKRWMIQAEVKKTGNGVQVLLDKRIEMQDEVSKSINKYKKETNEPKASGWKKTDIEQNVFDDLYRRIDQKLGLNGSTN